MTGEKQYSDWQQRVIEEKAALDEKRGKLIEMIKGNPRFSKLAPEDQALLADQSRAMGRYSTILGRRIDRFQP
jgi:hypothetical protein